MEASSLAPRKFDLIYKSPNDPKPISPSDYKDGTQAYGKREEGSNNFFAVTYVEGYGWVESADVVHARNFATSA